LETTKFGLVTHVEDGRASTGVATPQTQAAGPLPQCSHIQNGKLSAEQACFAGPPWPRYSRGRALGTPSPDNQILHGDQTRWGASFYRIPHATAL